MTIQVSTRAQGLLSLLEIQNLGESPRELNESFAPVIDATRFFLASKQSFETVNPGNAVAGVTGTVFQVPPGEIWVVHAADCRMAAGVGASIGAFGLVMTQAGPSGTAAAFVSEVQSVAASTTRWANLRFPGIVLAAGAGVGYYAETVVGAVPVFITVCASRLKA